MPDSPLIVLIPSPRNGPLVWAPVSRVLRDRGFPTLVATLDDDPADSAPHWVQHSASTARHLAALEPGADVLLAGYRGADPFVLAPDGSD